MTWSRITISARAAMPLSRPTSFERLARNFESFQKPRTGLPILFLCASLNRNEGRHEVHGGTDDTISLVNTTLALYGTDEMVFIGSGNATVNDLSTGLDLKIGPTAGVDVLSHFASDPSGVVDLIGGVGGFTTTAAALSALKSDGHGGTLLRFGHDSSLDFVGVTPSQLHAANFQIG